MKHNDKERTNTQEILQMLETRLSPPAGPPRQEVWQQLEKKIADTGKPVRRTIISRHVYLAVAAAFALLLAVGAVMRFYSVSYVSPPGEKLTVNLPGNSTVVLNADSKLSYRPLWWSISRELTLTGEAWFSVAKGTPFTVRSKRGKTTVLGTKFNIYARDDDYVVACISGKVKVASRATSKSIVLNPSDEAEIAPDGNIIYRKNINMEPVVAWKHGLFIFTSTPLKRVIEEIERRYNVHVVLKTAANARYTGSFPDSVDIYGALNFVCKPFGLNFAVDDKGVISIDK